MDTKLYFVNVKMSKDFASQGKDVLYYPKNRQMADSQTENVNPNSECEMNFLIVFDRYSSIA